MYTSTALTPPTGIFAHMYTPLYAQQRVTVVGGVLNVSINVISGYTFVSQDRGYTVRRARVSCLQRENE